MNMPNSKNIKISVIMPAFNEESNIIEAIDNTLLAFGDYNLDGEIIIVNDGSIDKTLSLVKERVSQDTQNQLKLINHEKPEGIGACFWDGLEKAKSEIVTMIPGDNENVPAEIICYVDLFDHVDIVVPFVFNKDIRSLLRNILSYLYRFIINITFGVSFNYTNGTILYRRNILNEFEHKNTGFFFQTEILIKLTKRGYLFAEVPYRLRTRSKGKSKALSFKSFFQLIKGYIGLVKDIYFTPKGDFTGRFKEGTQSAIKYEDAGNNP